MTDATQDGANVTAAIAAAPDPTPTLRVHVVCGSIENVGEQAPTVDCPAIDAIAVGHYARVEPQFAELALDNAISSGLPSLKADAAVSPPGLGIVTDFTTRRIIRGEFGVPFFLPDPRDNRRLVVIAGMGLVGHFGAAELSVLVEQLFWALARMGRKHLATVLIGSGTGNLETEVAVHAWADGAARAMASGQDVPSLTHLTFVELIPTKAERIRSSLLNYKGGPNKPTLSLGVTPSEPTPAPAVFPASHLALPRTQITTHVSGGKPGKRYVFGALSDEASYHEDHTDLDPYTILHANDELAAKETPDHQRQAGQDLFKLVVPKSLREAFTRINPIVIQCDKQVARLYWEMMVVPDLPRNSIGDGSEFLGIYPGITRQFRNSFEVPPEPPPRFDHTLRVLIVADTDANRRLPSCQDEATEIAALFDKYGESLRDGGSRRCVSVETLIGPENATRDVVLDRLLKYPPYDVLHFSGHCEYIDDDPPKSGWFFGKGKKITAYELGRVDRVSPFVFSNACSSGEMPVRVTARAVPSFAEAFFKQGVKNFVCTGWPVASNAAHDFAVRFYKELLGIDQPCPRHMYEAVREARKAIWATESGSRTWGAYQHYGNPWFKLA
jgi:CHAT domain